MAVANKSLTRFTIALFPVLAALPWFGLSMGVGAVFFLTIVFTALSLYIIPESLSPQAKTFLRALTVGSWYTVFSLLLALVDPELVDAAGAGLPLSAFAVFFLLDNDKDAGKAKDATRALWLGGAGFVTIAVAGLVREFLSTASVSLGPGQRYSIFGAEFDALILLFSAPAGLYLLVSAVLTLYSRFQVRGRDGDSVNGEYGADGTAGEPRGGSEAKSSPDNSESEAW